MKSKYRFRRILSGVMAAVTILSTVISPLTVYASEEPKAAEPPAYESVKDQLDENEVVKATDLELEVGQDFDVSTDFTNLEIKDESKVKVTFQKAENDAGENFSTSHAECRHLPCRLLCGASQPEPPGLSDWEKPDRKRACDSSSE